MGFIILEDCLVVVKDQLSTGVYIGVVTFISKVLLKCLWNEIFAPFFIPENWSLCCTDSYFSNLSCVPARKIIVLFLESWQKTQFSFSEAWN